MTGLPLRTILDLLADQIGGTCLIHSDHIEITTPERARPEAWLAGNRDLVPRVHARFKDTPWRKPWTYWLQETEYQRSYRRPRSRKGRQRERNRFDGQCRPDAAVCVLADTCNVKAVALDEVLYVTSKENAATLEKERDQRRAAREKEQREKEQREKAEQDKKAPAKANG